MKPIFHILLLEEDDLAANEFRKALAEAEIRCRVLLVKSPEAFVSALRQMRFDLIVSSPSQPAGDGSSAQELAGNQSPDTPFLAVAVNPGGDETAMEASPLGSSTSTRAGFASLIPAIQGVLKHSDRPESMSAAGNVAGLTAEVFQDLFEASSIAMAVAGPEGAIQFSNSAFSRIFGFSSAGETVGFNIHDLWPGEARKSFILTTLRREGRVQGIEIRSRGGSGRTASIRGNIEACFDKEGKPREFRCYFFDDENSMSTEAEQTHLRALSGFAGEIAHDINILREILDTSLTSVELPEKSQGLPLSWRPPIVLAAEKASSLARRLLRIADETEALIEGEISGERRQRLFGLLARDLSPPLRIRPVPEPGGSEAARRYWTILFVGEEGLGRETTRATLRSNGFSVVTARSGEEALRIYEVHHRDIPVVIIDSSLSQPEAGSLLASLAKVSPKVRAVFLVSSSSPAIGDGIPPAAVHATLRKPYKAAELVRAIDTLLVDAAASPT